MFGFDALPTIFDDCSKDLMSISIAWRFMWTRCYLLAIYREDVDRVHMQLKLPSVKSDTVSHLRNTSDRELHFNQLTFCEVTG
jgi:hypothetical protein